MTQLIGNIVQTRFSTYAFANREEAEVFYLQVKDEGRFARAARLAERASRQPAQPAPQMPDQGRDQD